MSEDLFRQQLGKESFNFFPENKDVNENVGGLHARIFFHALIHLARHGNNEFSQEEVAHNFVYSTHEEDEHTILIQARDMVRATFQSPEKAREAEIAACNWLAKNWNDL